ncbi:MAG: hypothetical protein WC878_05085 [Candidatus Paceibacterota bacterium]|jgi:hypothetical protein
MNEEMKMKTPELKTFAVGDSVVWAQEEEMPSGSVSALKWFKKDSGDGPFTVTAVEPKPNDTDMSHHHQFVTVKTKTGRVFTFSGGWFKLQ